MPNNTMSKEALQYNESVKIVKAFCKIVGVHPEELEYDLPSPITEEKAHAMVAFVKQYTLSKQIEARIDELKGLPTDWEAGYDNIRRKHYSKVYDEDYDFRLEELRKQQEELK